MAVIRNINRRKYTVVDNNIFQNKKLSLKARGMLVTLLSLPDSWEFSENGLEKIFNDGLTAIRSSLKELEENMYLKRKQLRDEKGKFLKNEWIISETPLTEQPIVENPITGNPLSENDTQLNTNKLNTKEKRKKESSYDEILSSIEDDGLRDLYFEYIKMRKMIKAPMTDRALTMLIKKVNELEPNNVENKKKLLEVAIMNNWKSVYPLKDTGNASNGQGGQTSEQAQKVLKMFGG